MTVKTAKWDPTIGLGENEAVVAYLDAAIEDGDPAVIYTVLGNIARARGITSIAEATGMSRTSLYKALSPDARPEFATILKVVRALGLTLRTVEAKPNAKSRPAARARKVTKPGRKAA